jgi:inhibitor of KinA
MGDFSIIQVGDQAVSVCYSRGVNEEDHKHLLALRSWFSQNPFPGLLDLVVAYNSLTLIYDAYEVGKSSFGNSASSDVVSKVNQAVHEARRQGFWEKTKKLRIPVCYEDPFALDLKFVCQHSGMNPSQVIQLHSEKTYRVFMIGFLPGFPYLGEVDARIASPRRTHPRALVEAGSVGIAGMQTGIYPLASPGGWQIIGKTPLTLFQKNSLPPVPYEVGDEIEFYPITASAFAKFSMPS